MEQSSFQDEQTVRHQFDSLCKLALKSEVINYEKHMAYRQKYEVMLSELSAEYIHEETRHLITTLKPLQNGGEILWKLFV